MSGGAGLQGIWIMTQPSRRQILAGLSALPLTFTAAKAAGLSQQHIVVIGAGVFGCWIALHLAHSGHKVTVVDAYGPANSRASSGGESRVIRISYGADRIYSQWALSSLTRWQALSAQYKHPLFHPCGVLWIAGQQDNYSINSLKTLHDMDVPVERLDKGALTARYPQMRFFNGEAGFLEPLSGGLMARRAVAAVAQRAQEQGVTFIRDIAKRPEKITKSDTIRIPLASGDSINAQAAVYACGPWLSKLFPDEIGSLIRATRQEVFYFGPPKGDNRFTQTHQPVWADFNGGDIYYGLPDLEQRGFKIAHDAHGPAIDPDNLERRISDEGLATIRAYIARRFPDLADAPLVESRVCQYENTASGDFLIDRHPDFDSIWFAGGGSGHGFKHGPALGHYVAQLVTGERKAAHKRFQLSAHNTEDSRAVH